MINTETHHSGKRIRPKSRGAGVARQVVTIAVFLALLARSAPAARQPLPPLEVPAGFGVNIHFRGEPRDLDMIAEGGFKVIRMDFTWGAIEKKKGEYDFEGTGYDALTEGCRERGIRLLYILDYSNRIYEKERSVQTDEGREAFAAFAEAAATRYAGQGILWEIWNEPNIRQFWTPQPSVEDYCKLVEAAAPRIRKVDPSGWVVAPATSRIPLDWLAGCFERGLLEWIDAVSVHPYRSEPPETVIEDYAKLRELIAKHAPEGKELPVISGEWGYSEINWNRKRLAPETQGRYLARMFLVNLWQGVPVSIWYDWKDDGRDPNEREHHFGTVTYDLKPKVAYRAAQTLSRTLRGYSPVERIDVGDDKDFVLKMQKGDDVAFAVWTTGEEHNVAVPTGNVAAWLVEMVPADSEDEARRRVGAGDGKITVTVSESPVYLLVGSE